MNVDDERRWQASGEADGLSVRTLRHYDGLGCSPRRSTQSSAAERIGVPDGRVRGFRLSPATLPASGHEDGSMMPDSARSHLDEHGEPFRSTAAASAWSPNARSRTPSHGL